MTEKFVVGLVGPPFGLEGFVKVKPFSGDTENLLKLKEVTIRRHGKEQRLTVARSVAAPPSVLMHFNCYNTPEEAKTLSGAEILVDRDQASPLAPGEFYIEDLKGLAVESALESDPNAGKILGHIIDIIEGGSGHLAEIKLSGGESRLVPFRREFFSEIDPKKGKITLNNLWILE